MIEVELPEVPDDAAEEKIGKTLFGAPRAPSLSSSRRGR
jgi:hypothetical protein